MDAHQARRAAAWLSRRQVPEEDLHTRYPWVPARTVPAGVAGRLPTSVRSALEARQAQRQRVYEQPRDGRGRWVAETRPKEQGWTTT